jgi:WD40-like Beta Propeller Repeat
VWSPDGESLLLGNVEIPLDGCPPRELRTAGGIRPTDRVSPTPPACSLAIAAADGFHPQELFGDWAANLVWSPTGDRIAFTSSRSGPPDELRVLDVATGTVTLLTES